MIIRLGPLPRQWALAWTSETLELLDALADSPLLPFKVPAESFAELRAIVGSMGRSAQRDEPFTWRCEVELDELKPLLTYWLNLGRLSDETVAASGARWPGDDGEQFHAAVLASLLDQLDEVDPDHAQRLRRAWKGPAIPAPAWSTERGGRTSG